MIPDPQTCSSPPTANAGEGFFVFLPGNGNSVPPESGDTLLSREQK